jgi:hypothetical protein
MVSVCVVHGRVHGRVHGDGFIGSGLEVCLIGGNWTLRQFITRQTRYNLPRLAESNLLPNSSSYI